MPVAAVAHGDLDGSAFDARARSSASRRSPPAMASHAFMTRLRSTCCSWMRSPSTGGRSGASSAASAMSRFNRSLRVTRSDVADHVAQSSRRVLHFALLQQRPQAPDHFAGALVVLDDVGQDLAHFVEVGRLTGHEALRGLGVAQDAHERLVDLVRERARELAQRRHARQMRELVALLLDLALEPTACGDVERHPAQQRGAPACAASAWPRTAIQRTPPLRSTTRNSCSKAPHSRNALSVASCSASRSSGCIRSSKAARSMGPVGSRSNSSRPLPDIHTSSRIGSHDQNASSAARAARSVRRSLSRSSRASCAAWIRSRPSS